MNDTAYYLIKSGKALDLVRKHIQEVMRVREEVLVLVRELGCERVTTNRATGELFGVVFTGATHPDFCKPNSKGVSRPRRGTAWAKRFVAQSGHVSASETIETAFGVPTCISYTCEGGGRGSRLIGDMLEGCGFAYLSADGPYLLWIPNVADAVADHESEGHQVDDESKAFKMSVPGCKRIDREEWEILVMKDELAKKKKARQKQAESVAA